MPLDNWRDDPVELERWQAWEDADHDPLAYRVLLDERDIQHPNTQPITDAMWRVVNARLGRTGTQAPLVHP